MIEESIIEESMIQEPLFSVIVPIYNAAAFLEQCLDSIVFQSIGFDKNVELILINDGSQDSSDSICLRYKESYHNNIIYHYQDNAGVSEARNKGLGFARGKYISFVDSDDCLSKHTFRMVSNYFRIARDLVDVAVVPVQNIGANFNSHYANGKFKAGTQTLDLSIPEWNYLCTRVGHAFFRSEALEGHKFDKNITYFEDTKFINQILSKKMLLGVVGGCKYHYRIFEKDGSADSLTAKAENDKRFYLDTPREVSLYLLSDIGKNALYFQYVALAEMRWRTFYNNALPSQVLTTSEFADYCDLNKKILNLISDEAICTFYLFTYWQKLFLLGKKYGQSIIEDLKLSADNDGLVTFHSHPLFSATFGFTVNLTNIKYKGREIEITGYLNGILIDGLDVCTCINGERQEMQIIPNSINIFTNPHEPELFEYKCSTFTSRIPLKSGKTIIDFSAFINDNQYHISRLDFPYNESATVKESHRIQRHGRYILLRGGERILIYAINPITISILGVKFLKKIYQKEIRKKVYRKVHEIIRRILKRG